MLGSVKYIQINKIIIILFYQRAVIPSMETLDTDQRESTYDEFLEFQAS